MSFVHCSVLMNACMLFCEFLSVIAASRNEVCADNLTKTLLRKDCLLAFRFEVMRASIWTVFGFPYFKGDRSYIFRWLFNITNQFQVHTAANDEKGNI